MELGILVVQGGGGGYLLECTGGAGVYPLGVYKWLVVLVLKWTSPKHPDFYRCPDFKHVRGS